MPSVPKMPEKNTINHSFYHVIHTTTSFNIGAIVIMTILAVIYILFY